MNVSSSIDPLQRHLLHHLMILLGLALLPLNQIDRPDHLDLLDHLEHSLMKVDHLLHHLTVHHLLLRLTSKKKLVTKVLAMTGLIHFHHSLHLSMNYLFQIHLTCSIPFIGFEIMKHLVGLTFQHRHLIVGLLIQILYLLLILLRIQDFFLYRWHSLLCLVNFFVIVIH